MPHIGCTSEASCPATYYCDSFTGCCKPISPIVIDVDGDGFAMTSAANGVFFDFSGNSAPLRISWTANGSDEGWLAMDRNSNGKIDNGKELFGNLTVQPLPSADEALNGFRALAVFDLPNEGGNGDGSTSQEDGVYNRLLVWQDHNHNGNSERSELSTLRALGISAISTNYKESNRIDEFGNEFRFRAKIERAGHGRGRDKWAYDVFLKKAVP